MAEAQSSDITDEHYAAFGRIVNTMAEIDAVLDSAHGQLKEQGRLHSRHGEGGPVSGADPGAEKLMDRVRTAHVLRDQIGNR
jgi:hypothetical protein